MGWLSGYRPVLKIPTFRINLLSRIGYLNKNRAWYTGKKSKNIYFEKNYLLNNTCFFWFQSNSCMYLILYYRGGHGGRGER